jgi:hypothetical protein
MASAVEEAGAVEAGAVIIAALLLWHFYLL